MMRMMPMTNSAPPITHATGSIMAVSAGPGSGLPSTRKTPRLIHS